MVTITKTCRHCDGDQLYRNGLTSNGKQRYQCKDCGRSSREDPQPQGYTEEERERILRAYQERSSLRGLTRTFGVSRNTVSSWLKKKDELQPELSTTLLPAPGSATLELDELWSFVRSRNNKQWIWIALCRDTRQIVAYYVGDRSEASCRRLWERIPSEYRQAHIYSDFWAAYQAVLPADQHTACGKESGQTSHVERWNNTLRQRLARFVRKTLSFSKCEKMHEICLRLFLYRYNLQRLT